MLYMSKKYDIKLTPKDDINIRTSNIRGDKFITSEGSDGEIYAGDFARKIMDYSSDSISLGITKDRNGFNVPHEMTIGSNTILHGAVFGQTGYGKSTLFINSMYQLIKQGYGLCFIDPKEGTVDKDGYEIGEDTHRLLRKIPKDRIEDVVYVNPKELNGYSVGINPLKIPDGVGENSEDTIETQEDLVKAMMMSQGQSDSQGFGARMAEVYKSIFQAMIRSDRDYTFADLHMLLNNSDNMDKFYEDLSDEINDDILLEQVNRISEMNAEDLSSIIRRTQRLVVGNRNKRNFVVNKETDIDFKDIIENDRILIIDIQSDASSIKKISMGYTINSLYSAAKKHNPDKPYMLFGDEFQEAVSMKNDLPLDKILEQGRSNNFFLWYATQDPNKIRNFVSESKTNLEIAISTNIDTNSASSVKSLFTNDDGNISSNTFNNVDKYSFLTKDSNISSNIVKAYAPYPPVRSYDEAQAIAEYSARKYGSKYKDKNEYSDSVQSFLINDPATLSVEKGMKIIKSANIYDKYNNNLPDTMDEYASFSTINKIIDEATEIDSEELDLSNWIENQISLGRLESDKSDDMSYYKMSKRGTKYSSEDSGKGGSSGGEDHKILVQKMRKILPRYGIHVKIPSQDEGGELPDGYGRVFDITDETPLKEKLSIGEKLVLEAEKETTSSKTAKMLKNLSKTDKKVLFISDLDKVCRKIYSTIYDNKGKSKQTNKFGRKFYNTDYNMKNDNIYPLRRKYSNDYSRAKWTRWYYDNDSGEINNLEVKDEDGNLERTFKFNSVDSFLYWNKEDFPAYARKTNDGYIVYDNKQDKKVNKYKSLKDIDNTKYNKIKKPFVPEIAFNKDITEKEFGIFMIPTGDNKYKTPKMYYNKSYHNLDEDSSDDNNNDDSNNDNNNNNNDDEDDETIDIF